MSISTLEPIVRELFEDEKAIITNWCKSALVQFFPKHRIAKDPISGDIGLTWVKMGTHQQAPLCPTKDSAIEKILELPTFVGGQKPMELRGKSPNKKVPFRKG